MNKKNSGITGDLILKDYRGNHNEGHVELNEKSPFVVVVNNKGKEMVVRKSSVCWLLSKDKYKLSSDRLQRVQEKEYSNTHTSEQSACLNEDSYIVKKEITVGEWCLYSQDNKEKGNNKILLGLVLGFSYLDGKTFRDREYSRSTAQFESEQNKKIGVLCSFYNFNNLGKLFSVSGNKHKHLEIKSYIGTIKNPTYVEKELTISKVLVAEIRKL